MYSVQENVLHQLKATCNKAILVPAPLAKNLVNFLYVYSWLVCVFILSFLSIVKYPLDIFFLGGGSSILRWSRQICAENLFSAKQTQIESIRFFNLLQKILGFILRHSFIK